MKQLMIAAALVALAMPAYAQGTASEGQGVKLDSPATTSPAPAGTARGARAAARAARAGARAARPAPVVPTTADFVRTATIAGLFEIESSKLAQEKSQDPKVQAFAKMMIDDHTKAGEELKAKAQGISGVEVPTALDAENQTILNRLKASSGDRFLKQYRRAQLKGHRQAVQLFRGYASGGENAGLKAWAKTTLRTLQHHLREARALPTKAEAAPAATANPSASAPASTTASPPPSTSTPPASTPAPK